MNVLVTGGAGYIGSHVVKGLLEREHSVVTLDNLSKGHRDAVVEGIFVHGNCGDGSLVKELVNEYSISPVVHLAADSLVGESMVERGNIALRSMVFLGNMALYLSYYTYVKII